MVAINDTVETDFDAALERDGPDLGEARIRASVGPQVLVRSEIPVQAEIGRFAIELEIYNGVGPVPAARVGPRPVDERDERLSGLVLWVAGGQVDVELVDCGIHAHDRAGQVIWCFAGLGQGQVEDVGKRRVFALVVERAICGARQDPAKVMLINKAVLFILFTVYLRGRLEIPLERRLSPEILVGFGIRKG